MGGASGLLPMFFGTISIIFRDPGQTLKIRDCPGRFGTVGAYASALTLEVTQLKQPSIVRIFPKDGPFVLSLKRNYSLR